MSIGTLSMEDGTCEMRSSASYGTMRTAGTQFIGSLQPTISRDALAPMVRFEKGGSDFRCLNDFTCMGEQFNSRKHYKSAGRVAFAQQDRFHSFGDKFQNFRLVGLDSLGRQALSRRRNAPSASFGTSTRDSIKKQYGIWN
ncbi:unnamed protein product [Chrysoparadoxa australica]